MKKTHHLLLTLLIYTTLLTAQSCCPCAPRTADQAPIPVDSICQTTPTGNTIQQTLGIDVVNHSLDQYYDGSLTISDPTHIFDNIRYHFELSDLYVDNTFTQRYPSDYTPVACTDQCPNIICPPYSPINAQVYRYNCTYDDHLHTTYALETIFLNGAFTQFPDKNFTPAQWGATIADQLQAAENLGQVLASSFPRGDAWELNEWWSPSNQQLYKTVNQGLYNAIQASGQDIELKSTSIQATDPNLSNGFYENYITDYIDAGQAAILDVITNHEYSFIGGAQQGTAADLADPPENNFQTALDHILTSTTGYTQSLEVTEYSYNSDVLGERLQSDYTLRALFIAMARQQDKFYYYNVYDLEDGNTGGLQMDNLFRSTGLFNVDKVTPKLVYTDIVALLANYGGYTYCSTLSEGTTYEYIFADASGNKQLVTWSSDDQTRTIDGHLVDSTPRFYNYTNP